MTTNRYAGVCVDCRGSVAAGAGELYRTGRKWKVLHIACARGGSVATIRTSGGTFTQNSRGVCEDAPCCGCCTI